jgi:hypothetical protein
MKYLIVSMCLLPVYCFSQNIPKDANTIIVKGVGFLQVCNNLLDSGWVIEKKDSELQTVRTESRDYPKYWSAKYCITIRVKDSVAYIGGLFTLGSGEIYKGEPVSNQTNKKGITYPKSAFSYPFLLINQWAKSFNKEITYQKM